MIACTARISRLGLSTIRPASYLRPPLSQLARSLTQQSHDGSTRESASTSLKPVQPTAEQLESFQNQQENYARPTAYAFDVMQRLAKYSIGGVLVIAGVVALGVEGTHQWIEYVELQPELKEDIFGWESERDRWSGGLQGGTDNRLGWWARRAVRSAWIPLNWGSGTFEGVIGSGEAESGGLNIFERKYAAAESFLRGAIDETQNRISDPRDPALLELKARHAAVVERMGGRANLEAARNEWTSLLELSPAQGNDTARISKRIGDLSARLSENGPAMDAWSRSLKAVESTDPEKLPSEPAAQRSAISALLSISGNYALQRELQYARATEETALSLLNPLPPPSLVRITKSTAPEQLHSLFLYHRSALFTIHLAEVLWAQSSRKNLQTSLEHLKTAAEKSEHAALLLTGTPRVHQDVPLSSVPHLPVPHASVLNVFGSSKTLKQPARSLLRDARRSAAEAWNLRGLLLEGGKNDKEALECFERALEWAGGQDHLEGEGDVLERDRKNIWRNWTRLRERVLNSKS